MRPMNTPWKAEVVNNKESATVLYFGDEGEEFRVIFLGPWAEMRAKSYREHIQPMMDDKGHGE